MKLKDIRKDLNSKIDLRKFHKEKKFEVLGKKQDSFFDISKGSKAVKIKSNEKIILDKSPTKNFDSVGKKKILTRAVPIKAEKIIISKKIKKQKKLNTSSEIKIKTKKINFSNFNIKKTYFPIVLILFFVGGTFLYKDILEKYLTYSYETLSFVKDDFPNIDKVNEDIQEAIHGFMITSYLFKPISFISTPSINNADNLIKGGEELTQGFSKFSRLGFSFLLLLKSKNIDEIYFSHFLDNSKEDFLDAIASFNNANNLYKKIGNLGEDDLNNKLEYLKLNLDLVLLKSNLVSENFDSVLSLLGHENRKKYMIVFQNSDEIRPQGGFMGSVGMIEIFGGKIVSFEKKDIYSLEWEINKNPSREQAPEGLNKITGTFGLRDANYFIGSGASSYKIKEFLEKADIQIDGVIYMNINIVLDLLDEIGGIDSKILGEKITSNNFSLYISSLVEAKKSRIGTLDSPKDVLFKFMDELTIKLKTDKNYKKYFKIILKNLASRDLFVYSFDEEEKKLLSTLGIDGEIDFNKTFDFNYPVFTSISGNKSDRYLERSFSKYTKIFDNCIVSSRLNIKVRHNFDLSEEKKVLEVFEKNNIDINKSLEIQGLGNNKQFVRVVLPKNSIIKNTNVEVKNYPNSRVVEFYMDTARFESSYFVLSYIMPNKSCEEYSYNFYKQPGIRKYNFEYTINEKNTKFTGISTDFEYKLK